MANRLYIRRFLNNRGHHAGGYILAVVEDTSKTSIDVRVWSDIEFTIADCGRQISLSFGVEPNELPNSLQKIDTLVDALTRFRAALIQEGDLEAARAAKSKATTAANMA